MMETFFGFKKTPFGDEIATAVVPFASLHEAKARLQFLADHHGAGLLTGEVGAGCSPRPRTSTAGWHKMPASTRSCIFIGLPAPL